MYLIIPKKSHPNNSDTKSFFHVKLDSNDFLISTVHIDGIIEFIETKRTAQLPKFIVSVHNRQTQRIPVINLKEYLNCKDGSFIQTLQSRVLFYRSQKSTYVIGVVFDEIIGFHEIKSIGKKTIKLAIVPNHLECFSIEFQIKLKDKFIHLLDLNEILDEVFIEKQLKHQ